MMRTPRANRGRMFAVASLAGAILVLAVGIVVGWPHLRFWWLFEPLGPNPQGYLEYRHRKTGIVFAARSKESPMQPLIEAHGQDFPDVIGAAEYDGLGVLE